MKALSFLVMFFSASSLSALGQSYHVDKTHSSFVAQILKAGIAKGLAHNHVIEAKDYQVKIALSHDEKGLTLKTFEMKIALKDLEVDATPLRKRYGLDPISENDRKKIRQNLLDRDQLWESRYSYLEFKANGWCVAPNKLSLKTSRMGTLLLRGKANRVFVILKSVEENKQFIKVSAYFYFKQSDFGYKPYRAALGMLKVQDRVRVNIFIVIKKD